MNNSSILAEGFFDKVKQFLRKIPKISSKQKGGIIKKLRVGLSISRLNKSIDSYEKIVKRELGDDYPDLPRFTPEDFVK